MAQWQMKLKVKDFYHEYPDSLTIQDVAQKMSERIDEKLPFVKSHFPDYLDDLEEIYMQFRDLSEDPEADGDMFDWIMEDLYNWADTSLDGEWNGKKLCWVETM